MANDVGLSDEPARNVGVTISAIAAVWAIINSIWPNLVPLDAQNAITQIALILIPFIGSLIIRSKVWSPASVYAMRKNLADRDREIYSLKQALSFKNMDTKESK